MTEYEQKTLEEMERRIKFNRQIQKICENNTLYLMVLESEVEKLLWELAELKELYEISHMENCYDINGRLLPNKRQILKEVEEDVVCN